MAVIRAVNSNKNTMTQVPCLEAVDGSIFWFGAVRLLICLGICWAIHVR